MTDIEEQSSIPETETLSASSSAEDQVQHYHASLYKTMLLGYERAQRKLQRLKEKSKASADQLASQFEGIQVSPPTQVKRADS